MKPWTKPFQGYIKDVLLLVPIIRSFDLVGFKNMCLLCLMTLDDIGVTYEKMHSRSFGPDSMFQYHP